MCWLMFLQVPLDLADCVRAHFEDLAQSNKAESASVLSCETLPG